jgi:hypothetical protein
MEPETESISAYARAPEPVLEEIVNLGPTEYVQVFDKKPEGNALETVIPNVEFEAEIALVKVLPLGLITVMALLA